MYFFTRQNSGGFRTCEPYPLSILVHNRRARSSENSSQILLPRLPFVLLYSVDPNPKENSNENPALTDSTRYNYYCCRRFYYTLYKDIPNGARHPDCFLGILVLCAAATRVSAQAHGGTPPNLSKIRFEDSHMCITRPNCKISWKPSARSRTYGYRFPPELPGDGTPATEPTTAYLSYTQESLVALLP